MPAPGTVRRVPSRLVPRLPIPVNLIEWRRSALSEGRSATRCLTWVAGDLAERQAGCISRGQLARLGFTDGPIDDLVRRRLLRPVHWGVYAVGHRARSADSRRMAALLALDEDGALAGWSAGEVWGAVTEDPTRDVDLVVNDGVHHEREGLAVRRSKLLLPADVTVHRRLAVVRPATMLLQLAGSEPRHVALAAADRTILRRTCTPAALRQVLDRNRHVRGRRLLLGFLADRRTHALRLRSELERLVAELLLGSDLDRPLFNAMVPVAGELLEVDVIWPERRLALEIDGRAYHEGVVAELEDARRDALLRVAGWRVIRVGWWDVVREPFRLLARLRRELRMR